MTTNDKNAPERDVDDESRRSFLEQGAIATVAAGAIASGSARAQENDSDGEEDDDGGGPGPLEGSWEALAFQNDFHPEARFTIISGVVDWNPNYGGIDNNWFTDYQTHMIRWLNTGEHVQFFISSDAEIGEYDENLGFVPDENGETNQPQVYEGSREWSPFENDQNLVTINFSPVEEETEDQLLESDDWWETGRIDDHTDEDGSGNTTDENGSDTNTTDDS